MTSKREQILNAVIEMMNESGLHSSIKVSDIAKQADVGKGTVYEYFSNKDEVLLEAILHLIDQNTNYAINRTNASQLNFTDTLKEIIKRTLENNHNMLTLFWSKDMGGLFQQDFKVKIKEKMKETYLKYYTHFKHVLNKGIEEGLVSADYTFFELRTVLTTISGSCMEFVHESQDDPNLDQAEFVTNLTKVILKILA